MNYTMQTARPVLRAAFLFIVAAFTVVSCAERTEVGFDELEQRSLDAWMKIHAPNAEPWSNGIYWEQILGPDDPTDGTLPRDGSDWVRIEFTGFDLDGNVFVSRTDSVARRQGTNTLYTHYEPLLAFYYSYNTVLPSGVYQALGKMRVGQEVRLYLPSRYAYLSSGSSYQYGYEGQRALAADVPAIIDLKLVETIDDVSEWETKATKTYAENILHITELVTEKDSLFAHILNRNPTALAEDIATLSTTNLYYVARSLDGFVIHTNIDSIAEKAYNDSSVHSPILASSTSLFAPKAFSRVLQARFPLVAGEDPEMEGEEGSQTPKEDRRIRYGEWVEMVFTSPFGYGTTGKYPSGETDTDETYYISLPTVIQPYTPLYVKFYTEKYEAE